MDVISPKCNAVLTAFKALMNKNYEHFSSYFTNVGTSGIDGNELVLDLKVENNLSSKMVKLNYPNIESPSNNEDERVMLPFITLVPFFNKAS